MNANFNPTGQTFQQLQGRKHPVLQQRAEEALADFASMVDLKRFAELFNEAVDLMRSGQRGEAVELLDELDGLAKPGAQREAVDALRKQIEGGL